MSNAPGTGSTKTGRTVVGIDIGQSVDPTALCVTQPEIRKDKLTHFVVRGIERLPIGEPYPMIADRLASRIELIRVRQQEAIKELIRPPCFAERRKRLLREAKIGPIVYVDATGVGKPVVDELRRKCPAVRIVAVYLTATDRRTETRDREVRLGKGYMVSRMQALFETGRIHLPMTDEAIALKDELLRYEVRITQAGHAQFGAFSTGIHDDLATALGLSVQGDPSVTKVTTLPWA